MATQEVTTEDGTFLVETEDTPKPTTGRRVFNADTLQWEDNQPYFQKRKPLDTADTFVGGIQNTLNSVLLGFGDEIHAGLQTGLQKGIGAVTGQDSRGYDENLKYLRNTREQFAEENPVAGGITSVAGAVASPISRVLNSFFKVAPAIAPVTAGIKESAKVAARNIGASTLAGLGSTASTAAVTGFGEGEGGFEKRIESAWNAASNPTTLATGAITGNIPGGAKAAAKGAEEASDSFIAQALNVQLSDLRQAAKGTSGRGVLPSPLKKAIDAVKSRGLFKGVAKTETVIARNEAAIESFNDEVESILNATRKAQRVGGKKATTLLKYDNTTAFIAAHPYEEEQLLKQLDKRQNVIRKLYDGTVYSRQLAKRTLYKKAFKENPENVSAGLDAALARDLKESIENAAKKFLSPADAAKLIAANKAEGEHLALVPILKKIKYQDEMPTGAAKLLRRAVISPVGGGVAASIATGSPIPAIAGGVASTRGGQFLLSDAFKKGASALTGASNLPSAAPAGGILSAESLRGSTENMFEPPKIPRDPLLIATNPRVQKYLLSQMPPDIGAILKMSWGTPDPAIQEAALSQVINVVPDLFEPSTSGLMSEVKRGDHFVVTNPAEAEVYKRSVASMYRHNEVDADFLAEQISALNDPNDRRILPRPDLTGVK